jgi:molecular chaperone GrpE
MSNINEDFKKKAEEKYDKTEEIKGGEIKDTKMKAAEIKIGEKDKKETIVTIGTVEYDKLKEAYGLAEEFKDKYLRAHAELNNALKRLVKEKEEYIKFANEDLLNEILYIIDNFNRASEHMNNTQKVESIIEGIKMIQKQFHLFLERNGVEEIKALGKKFDSALYEAIEHIETDESKDGIVVEEVQPGYLLNGRLLRPAAVKVGKKISKGK